MADKRSTIWIDTIIQHTVAVGTPQVIELSFVPDRFQRNNLTLERTILCLDFTFLATLATNVISLVDYGIGMSAPEALAAIPPAIPDPNVAADRPIRGWIYRCSRMLQSDQDGTRHNIASDNKDIRAKRKLDNGEAYIALENTTVEGVPSVLRVVGLIRMLYSYG